MSDNPFIEPEDNDRTVIRPAPGGRRPTPAASAVPAATLPPATDPCGPAAITVSPLVATASPLLQLLDQLRTVRRPPDPRALRERVVHDLHAFERHGRDAGIAMDVLRHAHHALCASLDDVVLNTPWGATSGWAQKTLVAAFHPGAHGADQFFDQLRHALTAPERFLPLIELMYLCLSLGFMGRYRQTRGEPELERIRAACHAAIVAQRQPADAELSLRWRGIAAPYQPGRRGLPVWVALAGAVALCGGLLFWTSASLNAASDALQARVLAAPPAHMPQVTVAATVQPLPPPPAPPEPTVLDRLHAGLRSDIDSGAIGLLGTPATPVIRIPDRAMFAPGSAVVQTASLPLLQRIAAALRDETGSLLVLDYTDNQPIRTVQFPSTFQLSTARANAVRAIVARAVGDPARVGAEGRGDADPIAPNATAEGREQNRRIEIVLQPRD